MRPARFAVLACLAGLLAACGGEPAAEPTPTPTSLAQLKPARMDLVRVGFCDLVPRTAVTKAVGAGAATPREWANGDQPPIDGAASDVAHELGCEWRLGKRAARAWVFARPVTRAFGRQVVAQARARKGCTAAAPGGFGRPGVLQTCTLGGKVTRVRHAGLFADTWLTCEVAGPERAAMVRSRADAWCLAVATTLNSGR